MITLIKTADHANGYFLSEYELSQGIFVDSLELERMHDDQYKQLLYLIILVNLFSFN